MEEKIKYTKEDIKAIIEKFEHESFIIQGCIQALKLELMKLDGIFE